MYLFKNLECICPTEDNNGNPNLFCNLRCGSDTVNDFCSCYGRIPGHNQHEDCKIYMQVNSYFLRADPDLRNITELQECYNISGIRRGPTFRCDSFPLSVGDKFLNLACVPTREKEYDEPFNLTGIPRKFMNEGKIRMEIIPKHFNESSTPSTRPSAPIAMSHTSMLGSLEKDLIGIQSVLLISVIFWLFILTIIFLFMKLRNCIRKRYKSQ